ncbi:hypothetical protein JL721_9277 [Aureococcus anophagefferens]|nr:hypothetical protein JL721_9277 [Aureococcus anophagefferens]
MQLPAHAVNVFVPLIDSGLRQGATEFVPKTHYDWSADERPVVLEAHAGDAVVFDWRLKHRGLANKGAANRPLLYMTYSKPWFVDKYNFSGPLPGPAAARPATTREAAERRRPEDVGPRTAISQNPKTPTEAVRPKKTETQDP